jgi:hypothetical protein
MHGKKSISICIRWNVYMSVCQLYQFYKFILSENFFGRPTWICISISSKIVLKCFNSFPNIFIFRTHIFLGYNLLECTKQRLGAGNSSHDYFFYVTALVFHQDIADAVLDSTLKSRYWANTQIWNQKWQ